MSEQDKSTVVQPKRWWHWILLYPTVALSIIAAVPTAIQAIYSYRFNVPYAKVQEAETQARLWQENFECFKTVNFSVTTNRSGVEIASAVCQSGDVLLRGRRPEWSTYQFKWIAWDNVAAVKAIPVLDQKAPVERRYVHTESKDQELEVAQAGFQVICQYPIVNGILQQRVVTYNGCFDQFINIYNGWVVSYRPSPCFC